MKTLELVDVRFSYGKEKPVLRWINTTFKANTMYAIVGPSGCGKTTLLSLLGGLDKPTNGDIVLDGESIYKKGIEYHRRNMVSFIFQNYNLIDYLTPIENVALTSKQPPLKMLKQVGLTDKEARRSILKLSGGEQQRVAIARALASDASLLLADEPTGNLDEAAANDIIKLLKKSAREPGKCVVVVTHSSELAAEADVILYLKRGVILYEN